jgi:hypothetical protein
MSEETATIVKILLILEEERLFCLANFIKFPSVVQSENTAAFDFRSVSDSRGLKDSGLYNSRKNRALAGIQF